MRVKNSSKIYDAEFCTTFFCSPSKWLLSFDSWERVNKHQVYNLYHLFHFWKFSALNIFTHILHREIFKQWKRVCHKIKSWKWIERENERIPMRHMSSNFENCLGNFLNVLPCHFFIIITSVCSASYLTPCVWKFSFSVLYIAQALHTPLTLRNINFSSFWIHSLCDES